MTEDDKMPFLERPRDDSGRFASKEAAPVETPAPQPAPEPVAAPVETPTPPAEPPATQNASVPPGYIPLAQALDEREKRQALQRELDDFRKKFEEATRKPPEPPIDPTFIGVGSGVRSGVGYSLRP